VPKSQWQGQRQYKAVLLTGATGYVGVYVLKELLGHSDAHIYCIVRATDTRLAEERLRDAFDWYFPQDSLDDYRERVTVLAGDVSSDMFGLRADEYDRLSSTVNAVYHFAADTRLFGPEEEFERHNVWSVKHCIQFAKQRRPKDLHYMSTLAVSGVNSREEAVIFDEDSLDVRQEFQNFYESTKYAAEHLLRQFQMQEGRAFVYRAGNISGDSVTGIFQRNAKDNRLVQMLVACTKVGAVPRDLGEGLVFSPVDEVAKGIVAISMNQAAQGGVYHVESPYTIPAEKLFAAISKNGIPLVQSDHPAFSNLFLAERDRGDPDIALAYFWATRRPRNFRYSHSRTHELLDSLGCGFQKLDDLWLSNFVCALKEQGVFGSAKLNDLKLSNPVRVLGKRGLSASVPVTASGNGHRRRSLEMQT
jgi:thioester reductase-like protein